MQAADLGSPSAAKVEVRYQAEVPLVVPAPKTDWVPPCRSPTIRTNSAVPRHRCRVCCRPGHVAGRRHPPRHFGRLDVDAHRFGRGLYAEAGPPAVVFTPVVPVGFPSVRSHARKVMVALPV